MSSKSSRSTPGLSIPTDHKYSCENNFGCPFRTADPARFRESQTRPPTDRSCILPPSVLPSDAELSLAYQAIKSQRRLSMISNNTHTSSKMPFIRSPTATVESRHVGYVSPPRSVASASNCPIRFLGHTSPEAVAEYFKNHKHELPKSHENCVKRHQTNTESIRELDAKYVTLVSMIQGLGEKHQPLLPDKRGEGETVEKIQEWAAGLKQGQDETEPEGVAEVCPVAQGDQGEGRGRLETQVDAQLKEIRLGESPTRPWGVHVPASAISSSSSSTPDAVSGCNSQRNAILTPSPVIQPNKSNSEAPSNFSSENSHPHSNKLPCPEKTCRTYGIAQFASFAELARHYVDEHDDTTHESRRRQPAPGPEETAPPKGSTTSPPMYFTGPIFIGYSAQEAMEISRQFSKGC